MAKANRHGDWGEFLARLILRLKGYRILARRFKTPVGEIDIIVQKKHTLIAVEVKYRASFQDAAYALTAYQQKRITRCLEWFLATTKDPHWQALRFDVMLCSKLKVTHIKNAWVVEGE